MEAKSNKSTEALKISGDWSQQADDLKDKFPQLTDADLKFERGKEEDLIKRLELRLHKKREEVINIIKKVQPTTV
ncbi:hypothetical protein [Flavobacterium sp.]|uniref:hypothetical protein n=1 Tax=Flavobacterium sp. TaxID=239 RepID=UPI00262722F9|nr:hypothetical protein [Flavobacterium sp.]